MNYLEAVPAIRRIDSSRDDLFAIDVVGEVNSADAENLDGLLEAACALHPRIDVLVRLTDFEIADWSETSPQTIEQGRQMALANVRRCASVGGPDWTRRIRAELQPEQELRCFPAEREAEAWDWLGAKPRKST